MAEPVRLAVFASGSGTNFQALVDRFPAGGNEAARVALLVASRPDAGAVERARRAGVPSVVLPPEARDGDGREERFLLKALRSEAADLVVLAGYLRLVPRGVVESYRGRMLNIHPALLPAFGGPGMYGTRVHRAVLEAGVRVTGVTVHFVSEQYDRGPIAEQWPVPVLDTDDVESLASRVLEVEHAILPAVVEALAQGWIQLDERDRSVWRAPWRRGGRYVLGAASGAPPGLAPEIEDLSG
ncbi:MAG: phosphoribosylglycinamide formyltransferase [Gemmatimonadota bacterium]